MGNPSIRALRKDLRVLEREIELTLSSQTGCCGITVAQCHLLLEVEQRDRTSVTELAAALELDKSTLSRAVDGLCLVDLLDRGDRPFQQAPAGDQAHDEREGGGSLHQRAL